MGQDTRKVVSPEEIRKAFDILGLDKSVLEKSDKDEKIVSEKDKIVPEKDEKEGIDIDKKPIVKSEGGDEDDDEAIQKAISEKEEELEELKSKFEEKKKKKKEPEVKEDDSEFKKGIVDTLSTILKETQSVNKAYSEQNEILKAQIDDLNSKIDAFGSQSTGRKSFSKPIEKSFNPDIEKGHTTREGKCFSKSRDKASLNQILFTLSGIEKGEVNDFYKNATLQFEASGNLEKSVELDLSTRFGINIED